MAKNVDDNVGRLLRFLDESGLARDTIVVFSTDHGEMHGSHGRTDKMVPYREATRIPLIVRWPSRIPAGARTDVLQTPMDHLPTLARLAGIEPPDEVDGLDLSPIVLDTRKIDREAVLLASYTSHWDFFQTQTVWPEWRGVETPRFTYARWLSGAEELYDNDRDPHQLRNLTADPASGPELARLRKELDRLLAEAHDEFLPGSAYAGWYDGERRLIRTGLGPVAQPPRLEARRHLVPRGPL
jgi:arylsulfatase A-like enzyme